MLLVGFSAVIPITAAKQFLEPGGAAAQLSDLNISRQAFRQATAAQIANESYRNAPC